MSERSPEDLPSTPITKGPHSGLEGVPEDVAERVDNPNFEFDTPLYAVAGKLPIPENLDQTANVRGSEVPTITQEQIQEGRDKIIADYQRQTADKKSKRQRKIALLATGGVLLSSAIFGAVTTAANPGGLPQAPVASAPPVPGTGEQTPNIPTTPATPGQGEQTPVAPEGRPLPSVDQFKFHTTAGGVASYDQLVKSVEMPTNAYKDKFEAVDGFFANMQKAINYYPDKLTVSESLGIPVSELKDSDYLMVAAAGRAAYYEANMKGESGDLLQTIESFGSQAAINHQQTLKNNETPYKMEITLPFDGRDGGTIQLKLDDNAALNSIEDKSETLGYYNLKMTKTSDLSKTTDQQPVWKFSSAIGISKVQSIE